MCRLLIALRRVLVWFPIPRYLRIWHCPGLLWVNRSWWAAESTSRPSPAWFICFWPDGGTCYEDPELRSYSDSGSHLVPSPDARDIFIGAGARPVYRICFASSGGWARTNRTGNAA